MVRTLVVAVAVAVAAALSPLVPPLTAHAVDATAAADGKRKINLAGRQRMLSQRMAKAACFAAIGLDTGAHMTMMREAHDLFERTLTGLREGDAEQGLAAETDEAVLEGLATVRELWTDYAAAVTDAVETDTVSRADMAVIAELNLPVLREMNRTVGLTERAYGDRSVPLHLAIALNISGRQRMLSQKMAKEFCLIAYGFEPAENRKALAGTVELFDLSLDALIEGYADVGIRPPQGAALKAQLAAVDAMWTDLKPVYEAVAAGADPAPQALVQVAIDSNEVLREMNTAVFLYERE